QDSVHLWDSDSLEELRVVKAEVGFSEGLAFSRNGYLATSGSAGLWVWDVGSGRELFKLHGVPAVLSVAFDKTGSRLASSDAEGVTIWDTKKWSRLHVLRGPQGKTLRARFSPSGYLLASTGRDGVVRLWDVKTGKEIRALHGHEDWVRNAVFSR